MIEEIQKILDEILTYPPNRKFGIAIYHLTQALEALKNDLLK